MAMKTIKIEYESLDFETIEMTRMSIAIDFKLEKKRRLFLYELGSCEGLNVKLQKHLNSDKFLKAKDYLSPIILKLNDEEYNEVKEYLSSDTVYEELEFEESCKFLNAKMSLLKQDVKFWET